MSDVPESTDLTMRVPVSPEDMELIFSGPALTVNRTFATMTPAGIRLTFMEQARPEAPLHFRTAIFIDFLQALALRDLLNRNLKGIEPEIRQVQAEARKTGEQAASTAQNQDGN